MLDKSKKHVFKKDVYLIGQDSENIKYWLEAPSWDCEWYWGFGYIETYTNNQYPERSKDIDSHQHWDGFVGQQHEYNFEIHSDIKTNFIHHINESRLIETVLTNKESWIISDLMLRFYSLRKVAGILHNGTGHLASQGCHKTKNEQFLKWINEVELPKIFKAIIEILTPSNNKEF